jgi:hypothetical protein
VRLQQRAICRHAITLGKHQDILAHHLAARDPHQRTAAHCQGTRTRQIAQRVKRVVRAPLLQHRDRHDDHHKTQQNERLVRIAHRQIDGACTQQQQEHGLGDDLQGQRAQPAPPAKTQFIGALVMQAPGRHGRVQPGRRGRWMQRRGR